LISGDLNLFVGVVLSSDSTDFLGSLLVLGSIGVLFDFFFNEL